MKLPVLFPALEIQDLSSPANVRLVFEAVRQMFARVAHANNNPDFGLTSTRPTTQLTIGQPFFDTTLGKPIWWKGAVWVDATGATV